MCACDTVQPSQNTTPRILVHHGARSSAATTYPAASPRGVLRLTLTRYLTAPQLGIYASADRSDISEPTCDRNALIYLLLLSIGHLSAHERGERSMRRTKREQPSTLDVRGPGQVQGGRLQGQCQLELFPAQKLNHSKG